MAGKKEPASVLTLKAIRVDGPGLSGKKRVKEAHGVPLQVQATRGKCFVTFIMLTPGKAARLSLPDYPRHQMKIDLIPLDQQLTVIFTGKTVEEAAAEVARCIDSADTGQLERIIQPFLALARRVRLEQ